MQDSNQFDVEIEDEEEGVIGDDEATQDTAVDPMQVCCLLCDSRHAVHCDCEGVGWGPSGHCTTCSVKPCPWVFHVLTL